MVAVRNVELVRVAEEIGRSRGAGKRGRVPKDLQKRVLSLVTSGVSIGQVAKSCGLSAGLIYKWRTDLRRSCRSGDLVKRLAVVPEQANPAVPAVHCSRVARILVNDLVIEIDAGSLPDVIAALRAVP